MNAQAEVEAVFRASARPVRATLVRLLGGFDLAEEALQDAFVAALEHWPGRGIPDNPVPWLVSAGRFKAIDKLRRRARFDAAAGELTRALEHAAETFDEAAMDDIVRDDQLRLIFACCHPALPPDAQIALTLREVAGLTTEAVAAAFLVTPAAMAQRIVRAKGKIRDERLPYAVPEAAELPVRLEPVLRTLYLIFNEGYGAAVGSAPERRALAPEAIRLARLLVDLLPDPEALGLLALMLLQQSRAAARLSPDGELIVLPEQDRTLWDRGLITEGTALVERAFASGTVGQYAIEARIAATHAAAPTSARTDWTAILGLFDLLLGTGPSAVVALNRAVAVAERDGPKVGLALIEALIATGGLERYRYAHAARADLLRRLGHNEAAVEAYRMALALTEPGPEQRFLKRRLDALTPAAACPPAGAAGPRS